MASTATRAQQRQSYILSVAPVNYSLTAGTDIPAPAESPPPPLETVNQQAQARTSQPTHGGIATMPGAFPSDHEPRTSLSTSATGARLDRTDSFQTPTSPASAYKKSPPYGEQRPGGVRRLFSLNSLRQSFSSSRTSLSQPRPSHDTEHDSPNKHLTRPQSRGALSNTASTMHSSRPSMRSKRSSNWFKRKSGFFMGNDDTGLLDVVSEDQRPDTREGKRFKNTKPAPLLPEVSALSGGNLNDGNLGWDEQLFKR